MGIGSSRFPTCLVGIAREDNIGLLLDGPLLMAVSNVLMVTTPRPSSLSVRVMEPGPDVACVGDGAGAPMDGSRFADLDRPQHYTDRQTREFGQCRSARLRTTVDTVVLQSPSGAGSSGSFARFGAPLPSAGAGEEPTSLQRVLGRSTSRFQCSPQLTAGCGVVERYLTICHGCFPILWFAQSAD